MRQNSVAKKYVHNHNLTSGGSSAESSGKAIVSAREENYEEQ